MNTSASKAGLEATVFETFDFEKILSNDCQDPNENFFNSFNFKYSQYFRRAASQCYT